MNKENAHQFLPFVEALAAGKTIQIRHTEDDVWTDAFNPSFSFEPERYRVKPEPREWTLHVYGDGSAVFDIGGLAAPRGETIRVREILD